MRFLNELFTLRRTSVGVCLIFLGFLVGNLCDTPNLKFSNEIDPLEFLSILSGVFIAVLVTLYIEKNTVEDRFEKDYLINQIDLLRELNRKKQFNLNASPIEYSFLRVEMNELRSFIYDLEYDIDESELQVPDALSLMNVIANEVKMLHSFREDNSAVDENNVIPYDKDISVSIEEGIITYSETRLKLCDSVFKKIDRNIYKLRRIINRC